MVVLGRIGSSGGPRFGVDGEGPAHPSLEMSGNQASHLQGDGLGGSDDQIASLPCRQRDGDAGTVVMP